MTAPEEQKKSGQTSKEQGKCKNGRQLQTLKSQVHITKPVDPEAVPILKYGVGNNFDLLFKKRLAIACMEKYKNLGRIIVDERYCVSIQVLKQCSFGIGPRPQNICMGQAGWLTVVI